MSEVRESGSKDKLHAILAVEDDVKGRAHGARNSSINSRYFLTFLC